MVTSALASALRDAGRPNAQLYISGDAAAPEWACDHRALDVPSAAVPYNGRSKTIERRFRRAATTFNRFSTTSD